MAIDFLGKEGEKPVRKEEIEIKMHAPEKQVIVPPKEKEQQKIIPKKEVPKLQTQEKLEEVNLLTAFKKYILKRRLTFIAIFVIIIAVLAGITYWLLTRPKSITPPAPQPVCGNSKIETNEQCDLTGCGATQTCINCQCQENIIPPPPEPVCGNGKIEIGEHCDLTGCTTNQTCVNCQCQEVITPPPPQPVCGNGKIETGEQCDLIGCGSAQTCVDCQCQTIILPDTELTSLRGALVKFKNASEIYLVEYNGELRLIDPLTVSFRNNQTIREIKADLIYVIADLYKQVRKGKEV
ncbi:MAG: hypothetical protein NT116_02185, partial [Candidatus Parcubacteria bacterium]|nr:hypothetical protein [Candidatus Parcubacteria bacterium]